jgi:pyruvate dehydrogenase E1 component beta subunit
MFIDFMGVCFDQIFNQAAKFRYMFGGKAVTPVTIRTMWGAGLRAAAQHSQSLLPVFTHVPGLKVAAPSNPYDAKGLLIQAIRDDDPVIFAEHKMLYDVAGDVPEESYAIPFGEANIVREGGDVTIVAIRLSMVNTALSSDELASSGIEVEIIDPRTTSLSDTDTILESVENTGGSSWSTSRTAVLARVGHRGLVAEARGTAGTIQQVTARTRRAVRRLAGRPVHPRPAHRRGGQDGGRLGR